MPLYEDVCLNLTYVYQYCYKILISIDHDKEVIDAQRSKESLILDGISKDDLFKISIKDYEKIYSQEYDPVFVNDSGQVVSIKDYLPKTNCTIECVYKYSERIITYDNGKTKVYDFDVNGKKNYVVECKNKIDYFIGVDYKKLRKLC